MKVGYLKLDVVYSLKDDIEGNAVIRDIKNLAYSASYENGNCR